MPRKIASIGVHARNWVTWHGFAINVVNDLQPFNWVIPCGLDTFGWSPRNRRKCAVVWGEPMDLSDLPRNRKGYAEAAERVGAEIVRLWRLAAQAERLSGGESRRVALTYGSRA